MIITNKYGLKDLRLSFYQSLSSPDLSFNALFSVIMIKTSRYHYLWFNNHSYFQLKGILKK